MPDILSPSLSAQPLSTPNIPVQLEYPVWKPSPINPDSLGIIEENIKKYPSNEIPMSDFTDMVKYYLTPEQIEQQKLIEQSISQISPSLKYDGPKPLDQRVFMAENALRYKRNPRLWNKIGFNPEMPSDVLDAMYDFHETKWESIKNVIPKLWNTASFQFKNYFAEYADAAEAIGTLDASVLYNQDRFTDYSKKLRDLEDIYPDYKTDRETKWYQLFRGDFWEESGSSIGFTLGTIGAALVENAAIAGATMGAGAIPELYNTPRKVFKAISDYYSLKRAYNLVKGITGAKTIIGGLSSGAQIWRLANGALSEAALEGALAGQEYVDSFIENYIRENGEAPPAEILEKLEKAKGDIAKSTILFQTPFLMASNAAQFGNLIAPKGFPKLLKSLKLQKEKFSFVVDDAFKVQVNEAAKKSVSPFLKPFHILKGSTWEGVEESYQALVSKTATDYYNDKYFNPNSKSLMKSLGAGFNYITSNEGMKEFMAGFATGAIFQHAGKPIGWLAKPKQTIDEQGDITFKENILNKTFGIGMTSANEIKQKQKAYKIAETLNSVDIQNVLKEEGFLNMIKDKQTQLALSRAVEDNDFFNVQNLKNQQLYRLLYAGLVTGKIDLQIEKLKSFASQDFNTLKNFFDLDETNYQTDNDKKNFMSSLRAFAESVEKKVPEFENIYQSELKNNEIWIKRASNNFNNVRNKLNKYITSLQEKYKAENLDELNKLLKDGKIEKSDVDQYTNLSSTVQSLEFRMYAVNEAVKASVFARAGMFDDAKEARTMIDKLNSGDTIGVKYNFELSRIFDKVYRKERQEQLQKMKDAASEDDIVMGNQLDAFKALSSYLDAQFENEEAYSVPQDEDLAKLIQEYFFSTQSIINNLDNNVSLENRYNQEKEEQRKLLLNFISLQRRNQENLNLINYLATEDTKEEYLNYQSDTLSEFFYQVAKMQEKEEEKEAIVKEEEVPPVQPPIPPVVPVNPPALETEVQVDYSQFTENQLIADLAKILMTGTPLSKLPKALLEEIEKRDSVIISEILKDYMQQDQYKLVHDELEKILETLEIEEVETSQKEESKPVPPIEIPVETPVESEIPNINFSDLTNEAKNEKDDDIENGLKNNSCNS